MKVFLTGATGFIGGHVARKLRERGDEVRALVRAPRSGRELEALGCELVVGDLADEAAIATGLEGCDAVIHGAAIYEVGIPESEHRPMYEANVLGTERVLRAALAAGTPKVVYVSTVGAFGNTHGQVVDETYQHPGTRVHLLLRADQVRGAPDRQAADRRGGPAVRDRPARRRLRPRRPLRARPADPRSSSPGGCR